jgi:hypothetical protein
VHELQAGWQLLERLNQNGNELKADDYGFGDDLRRPAPRGRTLLGACSEGPGACALEWPPVTSGRLKNSHRFASVIHAFRILT